MCFSAGASFAGGLIITATGIATILKVSKPSQIPFASIPLLFGLQQFSEGVIWVTLKSGGHETLQHVATLIFMIMALIIWPVMMPLSAMMMEPVKRRKKILITFLVAGAVVSAYYAICMFSYNFYPAIESYHIQYKGDFPKALRNPVFAVYIIATIPPLFVSSMKRLPLMGVLIFLSCLITGIFYKEYLTSVWCFFAALISVVIYWILSDVAVETQPDLIEAIVQK
jgi:uncharacterized membrane protein